MARKKSRIAKRLIREKKEKEIKEVKHKYFSNKQAFSYNRIVNFLVGGRDIGKTYDAKDFGVKRFSKYNRDYILTGKSKTNKAKFIYLRRNIKDIETIIEGNNFWGSLVDKYRCHNIELSQKGNKLLFNGEVMGYMFGIMQYNRIKSVEYNDVNYIMFDEFLDEDGRYKKNEVDKVLNIIESVARDRVNTEDGMRVVLLANTVSLVNPYFVKLGLKVDPTKEFNYEKDYLVQVIKNDEIGVMIEKQESQLGNFFNRSDSYKKISTGESFQDDTDVNIKKKPNRTIHMFNFKYNGLLLGFWGRPKIIEGEDVFELYVSRKHQPNSSLTFILDVDEIIYGSNKGNIKESNFKLNGYKHLEMIDIMNKSALYNQIYFEDLYIRTMGIELLKKIRVY